MGGKKVGSGRLVLFLILRAIFHGTNAWAATDYFFFLNFVRFFMLRDSLNGVIFFVFYC